MAANNGNPFAQWNLGPLYYSGSGVSKDRVAALMWLSIAIANGLSTWRHRMGKFMLARTLSSKQRTKAQKLALQWLESYERTKHIRPPINNS